MGGRQEKSFLSSRSVPHYECCSYKVIHISRSMCAGHRGVLLQVILRPKQKNCYSQNEYETLDDATHLHIQVAKWTQQGGQLDVQLRDPTSVDQVKNKKNSLHHCSMHEDHTHVPHTCNTSATERDILKNPSASKIIYVEETMNLDINYLALLIVQICILEPAMRIWLQRSQTKCEVETNKLLRKSHMQIQQGLFTKLFHSIFICPVS